MKENNNNYNFHGIGFTGLLTIVFITLKLCGVISWSWLWVLSPILISSGVGIILLLIGIIMLLIAKCLK